MELKIRTKSKNESTRDILEDEYKLGYSYGHEYGDEYGYGYGYGYGFGVGYGYGFGLGRGYGQADEEGDGRGYRINADEFAYYWQEVIKAFSLKWPDSQRQRMQELADSGATIAFWLSDEEGRANNGGTNNPVSVGIVEQLPGPLSDLCGSGSLHASLEPHYWRGTRWWIVALTGEVRRNNQKMWALKREILGECL